MLMHNPNNLSFFAPGDLVKLENYPEWGVGRVQSALGSRLTVSFENVGKRSINLEEADLTAIKLSRDGN